MFKTMFRILRPIAMIKRRAITKGLMRGDTTWLALGAIVFFGSRIKSLFGFGEPQPVYVEELKAGKRVVVAHAPSTSRRKRRSK